MDLTDFKTRSDKKKVCTYTAYARLLMLQCHIVKQKYLLTVIPVTMTWYEANWLQGPPLNRELVNGSHLLIVQNLPCPKWTLM